MKNTNIVSEHLKELKLYPISDEATNNDGLVLRQQNGELIFSGSANDLIEFADLLVSLALSGKNAGQHWHVDTTNLVSPNSEISDIVLVRD